VVYSTNTAGEHARAELTNKKYKVI